MARTVWILGDQLNEMNPGLLAADKRKDRVFLVEAGGALAAGLHHRQKLTLVFSAMRHFAAELRAAGWKVDYFGLGDAGDAVAAWRAHVAAGGSAEVVMVTPANFSQREAVERLAGECGLDVKFLPAFQFLVGREEFVAWAKGRRQLRMEDHYRRVRVEFGVLLEADGEPVGGRWNFDAENRKTYAAWRGAGLDVPGLPMQGDDEVVAEVVRDVERYFPDAPGELGGFWLPVTRAGARAWLQDFVARRLGQFGDFQDVMVSGERTMFHSLVSPMINLGLLLPLECVQAAEAAYRAGQAPLAAVEGFVRQIIGWREFVNGVYWLKMPGYTDLNSLGATRPLPGFFYTGETDLNCLHETLQQVIATGYNHHIQRLMVLGNFLLLAGVRPQEALRWFTEMYVDAHDWVMAANVIGMALHADGGFMASKPYVASGAYISKMSNYCVGCRFDPEIKEGKGACPFNVLYWRFYDQHQDRLVRNPRTAMIVRSWRKRRDPVRAKIVREADAFLAKAVPE